MKKYIMSNLWAGEVGNTPGIGHQFRLWLVGYTASKRYKCTFVHQPFLGEHTQEGDGMGRVDVPVSRWNDFLNFGNKELYLSDLADDIRTIDLPQFTPSQSVVNQSWVDIINKNYDEDILFHCPFNCFDKIHWDIYTNNNFASKYWEQRKSYPTKCHFDKNRISIAVHIRRCDVTRHRYPGRYLPNIYYEQVLKQLSEECPNADIHIYSDAKSTDEFQKLSLIPNATFHLCTDIFETFHALTSSQIFVAGMGSFSVLASYLSQNVIITTPWNAAWNLFPENTRIVSAQNNGNFSIEILREKICGDKKIED